MNNVTSTTELTENTEIVKDINQLTGVVIRCAIDVHRAVGPGLLESAYEICLCRELSLHNVPFECQKPLSLRYKGVKLDCGYRADLIACSLIPMSACSHMGFAAKFSALPKNFLYSSVFSVISVVK
jgi:GxxExxY protein